MMRNMRTVFSRLALMVLIVAMVLSFAACGGNKKDSDPSAGREKTFTFLVVDADGNCEKFDLQSSADSVGDALLAEGIIEGEDGAYGLYVKKVNGITADYDVDGHYWAFYIGDEYAAVGVDQTEIEDGASYAFKVE